MNIPCRWPCGESTVEAETIFEDSEIKILNFLSWNYIWKCRLGNGGHFVQGGMTLCDSIVTLTHGFMAGLVSRDSLDKSRHITKRGNGTRWESVCFQVGGGYSTNSLRCLFSHIFYSSSLDRCFPGKYRINIWFTFDRCHRSSAAVTPVKYGCCEKDSTHYAKGPNRCIKEWGFSNPHPRIAWHRWQASRSIHAHYIKTIINQLLYCIQFYFYYWM